ncbi:MAG: hypothetical protein CMI04_01975 [Oceanospirillaceae bacterium]|nr:hypothetical protein [Oceanospirillaceae bacterium]
MPDSPFGSITTGPLPTRPLCNTHSLRLKYLPPSLLLSGLRRYNSRRYMTHRLPMTGLLILLLFLVAGNLLQSQLDSPVPGSIIGMLLLLVFLMIRGRAPESLSQISKTLSPLLPLFIIPVSVGIVTQKELLAENGIALLVIMAVSIVPGAIVCAAIMKFRRKRDAE